MASSAKKPKKQPTNNRRRTRSVIIVLASILLLLVGFKTIQYIQDQRQLTASLNQKGRELDILSDNLKDSGIAGNIVREQYCYEAARKFEKGPTYCVQELNIKAVGLSDAKIIADFSAIENTAKNQTNLNLSTKDIFTEFDETHRIYASFYQLPWGKHANCSATFYGKNGFWHDKATRSSYEVRIYCLGTSLFKNIYEFRE